MHVDPQTTHPVQWIVQGCPAREGTKQGRSEVWDCVRSGPTQIVLLTVSLHRNANFPLSRDGQEFNLGGGGNKMSIDHKYAQHWGQMSDRYRAGCQ